MKKMYIFVFACGLSIANTSAQTIINYGKNSVSKDEFWRAYTKNQVLDNDKEKSLNEYVELYTNFKLKVRAAQDLRFDTLHQLQYDVENFRNQITDNYLNDEKGMRRLQLEAFQRSLIDKHSIHIAIKKDLADPAKAEKAIKQVYASIKNDVKNYKQIVEAANRQFGEVSSTDLGYITAFTVPYEFENIIFGTPVGNVSEPYQTSNNWHLFLITDEKPASGTWTISQILFTLPQDASVALKDSIRQHANKVYQQINSGAISFGAAAKMYSEDKITYLTEGELPPFTSGKYAYEFESPIFALKNDGDITAPFETSYGFHIVKRLKRQPVITDATDENNLFELKQKITNDSRIEVEREKFKKEIIGITGIKKVKAVSENDIYRYADTLMNDPSELRTNLLPISKTTLLTFKDGTSVKGDAWLKYVRNYRTVGEHNKGETNSQLWQKFIDYSAVEYYKQNLERYNEEFKFQMKEFKEGNMLFEVMEKYVWNKAAQDSIGLKEYYQKNSSKYTWDASADILIFSTSDLKSAERVLNDVKAGKDWKSLVETYNGVLNVDSGRYELAQIISKEVSGNAKVGEFSPVVENPDGTASFVKYLKIYQANLLRNFNDARGLVINDYQNLIEEKWLQSLREKYPVKVNQSVVKQLLK